MKKVLKIFLIVSLLLIISIYLLIITPPGHYLIKQIIQGQLSRLIETPVKIDRFQTDLFHFIQLSNLVVGKQSNRQQPIVFVERLKIEYSFWGLLRQQLILKNIRIDNPQIAIVKDTTGHYNFPTSLFSSSKDTLSQPSSTDKFKILFGSLKINHLRFSYFDQRDSITIRLNPLELSVDAQQLGQSYVGKLTIESGDLNWRNRIQRLHQCTTNFSIDSEHFVINQLLLRTDALNLKGSGSYDFNTQSIHAGQVLSGINLDFLNQFGLTKIERSFEGLISIQCDVEGKIDQPDAKIKLKLDRGLVYNIPIQNLNIDSELKNQEFDLKSLSFETFSGIVGATGRLIPSDQTFFYQFDLSFQEFQLDELLKTAYPEPFNHLQGIVNGNFKIAGEGNKWNQLIAQGKINLFHLSTPIQSFNEIQSYFSLNKGEFGFKFLQDASQIHLIGNINSDNTINGKFSGNLLRIEPIARLANLPELKGQLQFAGDINGQIESPAVNSEFHLQNGSYQGFPLTNIEGKIIFEDNQLIFPHLSATGNSSDLQEFAGYLSLDTLAGNMTYQIAACGDLDELIAIAEFNWNMAKINYLNFDTLNLSIKSSGKDFFVNKFNIKKQKTMVSTTGEINLNNGLFVDLISNIFETDSINQIISNRGLVQATGKIREELVDASIQGRGIVISWLAQFIPSVHQLDGKLDFEGHIFGTMREPDFNLSWNLISPIYKNKILDSLFVELKYHDHFLVVSKILASNKNGWLLLNGEIPIDLYQFKFPASLSPLILLEADNFDLAVIEPFLSDSIFIGGKLSTQLQWQGEWHHPQLDGALTLTDGYLKTSAFAAVDSVMLSSHFMGQQFRLENFGGKLNQFKFAIAGKGYYENLDRFDASIFGSVSQIGKIQIQGNCQDDQSISGQLQIDDLNLNNLARIVPIKTQVRGLMDVVMDVTGTRSNPFITLKINSDQIGIEKIPFDSLHFNVFYNKNLATIEQSGFKIGNGKINFTGNVPIKIFVGDSTTVISNDMKVESYANDLVIDWIRPFFPALTDLQGKVDYDLKLTGALDNPTINGIFNLKNGLVKLKDITPEINEIQSTINFSKNKIEVENFSGKIETGSFNLQGQTLLAHGKLSDANFAVSLDKIKLMSPKLFSIGIEKGDMALTQEADRFNLKGKIQLKEAKYVQDYRPKINQFLTQLPNRPQTNQAELLNKINLDVIIQGKENIWVENNLAKLQMSSNLNLFGTIVQPNISGRIVLIKGYILYLDRKFKITNGLIDFTDPHRINPYIDITAVCTITDFQNVNEKKYTITLKLSGLLEKPDFMLVSEPALDKANIVAVLTIGRTRENLFPQTQASQGQSFQQIMLDRFKEITSQRIAGMTEQKLSRTLALENVTIEGNLFQLDSSWGPRLTATKKLSDRINITYSTVVGHANEQQIKLGYQLYKYLSIIGNTGQTGQTGLDLKFHFKFY